ncbi:MAG: photosynthetic reaction center subunit H, partial [Betaproteobacteria bacterium]|nr:photosynthetic reaction center subunit H [Betaproteobacteria bacterium]
MQTGAITGYIDVAQLVLYAFWVFFAGLIYYLHRENKREGYPLESDRSAHITVQGWPAIPAAKSYLLRDGSKIMAPAARNAPPAALAAVPAGAFPGAPLQPTGEPMLDGVGPASYAMRADKPDLTVDDQPRIVPMRAAQGFSVASNDPDPRGMAVVGADGATGGTVVDLWVDRAEMLFRYLELETATVPARRVLLPINFARIDSRQVNVKSILGAQFAKVP